MFGGFVPGRLQPCVRMLRMSTLAETLLWLAGLRRLGPLLSHLDDGEISATVADFLMLQVGEGSHGDEAYSACEETTERTQLNLACPDCRSTNNGTQTWRLSYDR